MDSVMMNPTMRDVTMMEVTAVELVLIQNNVKNVCVTKKGLIFHVSDFFRMPPKS